VTLRFWVRLIVSVLAALVFRVTLGTQLAIAGVQPDLLAAVLFSVTLARGAVFGVITGFVLGLIVDVDRPAGLGLTSLAWCTMAYVTARISDAVEASDPIVASALLLLVVLIAETIRALVVSLGDPVGVGFLWVRWALPTALYTGIAAPLIAGAARKIFGWSRWFGGRT
jgi:rod shape-determining protein MreD